MKEGLNDKQEEINQLYNTISGLKEQLSYMAQNHQAQIEQLESNISDLKRANIDLKTQISVKDDEVEKLQQEIAQKEQNLAKLKKGRL